MESERGKLHIVSVGVGDADNMTVKAQKTIRAADLVLCMPFMREHYAEVLQGKEIYDAGHLIYVGDNLQPAR